MLEISVDFTANNVNADIDTCGSSPSSFTSSSLEYEIILNILNNDFSTYGEQNNEVDRKFSTVKKE